VQLLWIEAKDFRNHREVSLELRPGLSAAVGPNGRGKTNLLEAMYYLCALTSPRVSTDLPLVRSGASSAYVRGEVAGGEGRALIEVEVRANGQNKVHVNRSAVRRKRDLRRRVRAVFGGPDDLAVVLGDPAERRRFMDEAVAALWPGKEAVAAAYERVLRQRNRLLKDWSGTGQAPGLEAWDGELVAHGAALISLRARAVGLIRTLAAQEFERLAGEGGGTLEVQYRPSVEAPITVQAAFSLDGPAPPDGFGLEAAFRERLAARRDDELIRRTTLVGPHRDDLALSVRDIAARGFASHGEACGAAVALRLALARARGEEVGEDPILFLDDPFSALDPDRRRRLAEALQGRGQVILAVPDRAQVPLGANVWCVEEGHVEPV
jgi:DNA replication and repair protein RecF